MMQFRFVIAVGTRTFRNKIYNKKKQFVFKILKAYWQ